MEKRVVLFIIITFLIFIGFQHLLPEKYRGVRKVTPQTEVKSETPVPSQSQIPAPETSATPNNASLSVASREDANATEDTQASAQKIVIEGDLYRAVLDNQGGMLTSWELKNYYYKTSQSSKNAQKRVFDIITPSRSGDIRMYPGALIFGDDAVAQTANNSHYQVSIEGQDGETLSPPVVVRLTLKSGELQIEKTWRFEKDNYIAGLSITGTYAGKPIESRFFIGEDIGPEEEHLTSSAARLTAVYFSDKIRRESPPKDPQELKKFEGTIRWAGLDMQYFSLIAIPKQPSPYFNIQKKSLHDVGVDGEAIDRDMLQVTLPIVGNMDSQLYLGPKKQENLKASGAINFDDVIDYGFFSFLVYPLLATLRWIHQFVQNYGAAIIIITFILSLLLFPFRLKSMMSMRKMSAVQPKVKAIQEKYRKYKTTDPKKAEMNQEIMALYKAHNVNPMGGCLPMLLQFPFLFAFYSMLAHTIDLRQAPFIWWLTDLSAKDPYYILPIVMGITSFISQKMTPMAPSTDPAQAKMMMFMPIVFTFFFLNLSSGLNLYFLCSNIFQVALQKIAEPWIKDGRGAVPSKPKAKASGGQP